MNEAELAQVLGEAFRQYSNELKQGTKVHPDFLPMLAGKPATITMHLTKNGAIEIVWPQTTTITMSNMPDLPHVEPEEEKLKPRKKTV